MWKADDLSPTVANNLFLGFWTASISNLRQADFLPFPRLKCVIVCHRSGSSYIAFASVNPSISVGPF